MIIFNLIKKYYFSIFHEQENTKLNLFHLFQKKQIFRVLHAFSKFPTSKITKNQVSSVT